MCIYLRYAYYAQLFVLQNIKVVPVGYLTMHSMHEFSYLHTPQFGNSKEPLQQDIAF